MAILDIADVDFQLGFPLTVKWHTFVGGAFYTQFVQGCLVDFERILD
ncbi:MAG: hypothetical protein OQK12_12075 [Motiliproteus sp.]|nr:hypothetical protein [Motiliproteus sp.]MCW9051044.1 hypothetical protein [Motiliproteus sp.]